MNLNHTQTSASDLRPSKKMKLSHIDTCSDSVDAALTAARSRSTATPSPVNRKQSLTSNNDSRSPASATSLESSASCSHSSSAKLESNGTSLNAADQTDTTMQDPTAGGHAGDAADRLSTRRNRKLTAKAKELVGTKFYPATTTNERPSPAPFNTVVPADAVVTNILAPFAPTETASASYLVKDTVETPDTSIDSIREPAVNTAIHSVPVDNHSSENDVKKKPSLKLSLFIKPTSQPQTSQNTTAESSRKDDRAEKLCAAPASAHGSFVTLHVNWRKFSRLSRQKRPSMSVASLMAKQLQKPSKSTTKPKKESSADADTAKCTTTPSDQSIPSGGPRTEPSNLSVKNRSDPITTKPQVKKPEIDAPLFCGLKCLDPIDRILAFAEIAGRKDLDDAIKSRTTDDEQLQALHRALQTFCRCPASATTKVKGQKAKSARKSAPKQMGQMQIDASENRSTPIDIADSKFEDAPVVDEDTIVVDVSAS